MHRTNFRLVLPGAIAQGWSKRGRMNGRVRESLVALRRILRTTDMNARNLARETGLTMAQLLVLQVLADFGPLTAKEISTRVGVSQATMTSVIDRMENKELVTREKSEIDRRQTIIIVTERGSAMIANAPDPLQAIYSRRFATLSDWEQAMIVATLERVASLLDANAIDAAPVLDVGAIEETSQPDG